MIEFPLNFFFLYIFCRLTLFKETLSFPGRGEQSSVSSTAARVIFWWQQFFTTFSDVNRFTCRVNTPELPLNKYISKLWYFLSLWYEMEKGSVYSRWTGSVVDCSRRFIDCVLLDHKVHLIIVMKTNMNE